MKNSVCPSSLVDQNKPKPTLQQNENIANIHETSQRPKAQGGSTDYTVPLLPQRHNATLAARRHAGRSYELVRSCSAIRRLRRSGGPTASSGGPASGSIPPASLLIGHLAPGVETVELLGRGWDVARGCELCERGRWEGHAPPPQGGRYPGVRGGGRRSRRAVAARLTLTLSLTLP